MSTRGLYGVVIDGEVKASYNHYDSYPSGLGYQILKEINAGTLTADRARYMRLVDESGAPTQDQITTMVDAGLHNPNVSSGETAEWYSLMREAQGKLHANLTTGYMIDNLEFASDSLFCEWGYLVNFDTNRLEVYEGFNENTPVGRFQDMKGQGHSKYRPITLVAEIPFAVDNGVAMFKDSVAYKEAVELLTQLEMYNYGEEA